MRLCTLVKLKCTHVPAIQWTRSPPPHEEHPMEYRHLGRFGVEVSPLCLGTMNFGRATPEDEGHAIMDRALELGINFFDTANVYGDRSKGLTEQILGRWFAKGDGRREKVVLATKVYGSTGSWPNAGRLS